jgi:EpsI family protein
MRGHWRFPVTALLLAATALLLATRSGSEVIPGRTPLASFPQELQGWNSTTLQLDDETRTVLGPGDFLLRQYSSDTRSQPVTLFIAYFPTQSAGDAIHSPKNCLPGSGWAPVQADRIEINVPGHSPFPANRYIIAQGEQRELVLYWYWAHDRGLASEYAAKFYLVADSIRMHRSDGSLVRLSIPLERGESIESAQELLLSFAGNIVPVISTYVPQ